MTALDEVQTYLWEILDTPEDDPRVTMDHKIKAAKVIADVNMKKAYIYANGVAMIEMHGIQEQAGNVQKRNR